jgi:hypothetical protein
MFPLLTQKLSPVDSHLSKKQWEAACLAEDGQQNMTATASLEIPCFIMFYQGSFFLFLFFVVVCFLKFNLLLLFYLYIFPFLFLPYKSFVYILWFSTLVFLWDFWVCEQADLFLVLVPSLGVFFPPSICLLVLSSTNVLVFVLSHYINYIIIL